MLIDAAAFPFVMWRSLPIRLPDDSHRFCLKGLSSLIQVLCVSGGFQIRGFNYSDSRYEVLFIKPFSARRPSEYFLGADLLGLKFQFVSRPFVTEVEVFGFLCSVIQRAKEVMSYRQ